MIEVSVRGVPVPKQSFRVSFKGYYRDPRITDWQTEIALAVVDWLKKNNGGIYAVGFRSKYQLEAPVYQNDISLEVSLDFFIPDKRRVDLDNLSKAVLDALNGLLWADDRQVIRMTLSKWIGVGKNNAGVIIKVKECEPLQGKREWKNG